MILNTKHYYKETVDYKKFREYIEKKYCKVTGYDYVYRIKKLLPSKDSKNYAVDLYNNLYTKKDILKYKSALMMFLIFNKETYGSHIDCQIFKLLNISYISKEEYIKIIMYNEQKDLYIWQFKVLCFLIHTKGGCPLDYKKYKLKDLKNDIEAIKDVNVRKFYTEYLLRFKPYKKNIIYARGDFDYYIYRLTYSKGVLILNRKLGIKELLNLKLVRSYV